MSANDVFGQWGIIIAFFIGLTGLGTFVWNMVKGYKKRQDEREENMAKIEEAKAAVIKKDIEIRAGEIKKDAEETAKGVKEAVENRASIIKLEIEATARSLREHNQLMITEVLNKIRDVDDKVMKMLQDLSTRADLTNGNVKAIRTEIADVRGDVQDLWALVEDTDDTAVTRRKDRTMSNAVARRRKAQRLARRAKASEIETDSQDQEITKHSYANR